MYLFQIVANFDVSMTKYYTTQDSDKIRAEIQVELLSQVSNLTFYLKITVTEVMRFNGTDMKC